MKYNKSEIMKAAWKRYNDCKRLVKEYRETFSQSLRYAWRKAKEAAKTAAEIAAKGIVRMHYSEYKATYSDCQTVEGSYDKRTKTIEVMTKVAKAARTAYKSVITRNGICPRCHTYCYGDCTAH